MFPSNSRNDRMFGPIFLIITSSGWERSHWHFLYCGSENFLDISRKCEACCNDVSIVFVKHLVPGLVWQQLYQLWALSCCRLCSFKIIKTSGESSFWFSFQEVEYLDQSTLNIYGGNYRNLSFHFRLNLSIIITFYFELLYGDCSSWYFLNYHRRSRIV